MKLHLFFVVGMFSAGITKALITRVVIITFIYSIISYLVIQKNTATQDQLTIAIPLIFVMFGVVILINILFCLRKYNVMNTTQ